MTATQSRTQRFRGRSPPDRDEWEVSTVALRGTNQSGTTECAVTGTDYEYDHLVVADGGIGELDVWLKGE